MKKILSTALFLMTIFSLQAQNGQKILPLDSPFYAMADTAYSLSGRALPSTSRPWSIAEARKILAPLENAPEVASFMEPLQAILDQAAPRWDIGEGMEGGLGLLLSAEIYGHSNTEDFVLDSDWEYGYRDRLSAVKTYFELSLNDSFYTYADLEYKRDRYSAEDLLVIVSEEDYFSGEYGGIWNAGIREDGDDYAVVVSQEAYQPAFSINIPDPQYTDFETPYRAFVSFGGDSWTLQAGRDLFTWGNGHSGNLILGDHRDFYDAVHLSVFSSNLKYEYFTAFFDPPSYFNGYEVPSEEVEAFIGHRIEYSPFSALRFSLSENVMYRHSFYDLRYFLNPAYLFHNYNNRRMFNALASAEVNYTFLPGWSVYGQTALDQAQALLESATQPHTMGFIFGSEYRLIGEAGFHEIYLEGIYNDPYLYYRDVVDFKVRRRQFVIEGKIISYEDYLGYRYGGDCWGVQAGWGYQDFGWGRIDSEILFLRHGGVTIQDEADSFGDYPAGTSPAPSGNIFYDRLRISLYGEVRLPQLEMLSARFHIDGIYKSRLLDGVQTDGAFDLQGSIGFTIEL